MKHQFWPLTWRQWGGTVPFWGRRRWCQSGKTSKDWTSAKTSTPLAVQTGTYGRGRHAFSLDDVHCPRFGLYAYSSSAWLSSVLLNSLLITDTSPGLREFDTGTNNFIFHVPCYEHSGLCIIYWVYRHACLLSDTFRIAPRLHQRPKALPSMRW
jgi:hypothetical protein